MTDDQGLVASLARCQAKFTTIPKADTAEVPTKTGGKYTYSYASLADTLAMCVPVLAAEGIVLLGPMAPTDDGLELGCELRKGDERIWSSMPLRTAGLRPQEIGSLITYGRRYLVTALLALATDDDDGQAAQDAPPRATGRDRAPAAQWGGNGEPATENQQKAIAAKLGVLGAAKKDEKVALLKHLTGFETTKELSKQQASDVLDALKPFEDGQEWGMFVYSNAGQVSIVEVGAEPFEVKA